MTIKFRNPIVFRAPAVQVDAVDSPLYAVGTIAEAVDSVYGNLELIYLKAGSGVTEAVGSFCGFGGDYETVLGVANGVYSSVAVSLAAKTAGQFGWYVKSGNVPTLVLASFADNANCYLTSTAGSLDDAVVAGDYVYKAKSISAISAGLAVIYLDNAFTTDGLA